MVYYMSVYFIRDIIYRILDEIMYDINSVLSTLVICALALYDSD